MNELGRYLLQALVTLALLGVLAAAVVWAGRRWLPAAVRGEGAMRVVEATAVGMGVRLLIVEVEGRRLLIGATPQSVNLICDLTPRGAEATDD